MVEGDMPALFANAFTAKSCSAHSSEILFATASLAFTLLTSTLPIIVNYGICRVGYIPNSNSVVKLGYIASMEAYL